MARLRSGTLMCASSCSRRMASQKPTATWCVHLLCSPHLYLYVRLKGSVALHC